MTHLNQYSVVSKYIFVWKFNKLSVFYHKYIKHWTLNIKQKKCQSSSLPVMPSTGLSPDATDGLERTKLAKSRYAHNVVNKVLNENLSTLSFLQLLKLEKTMWL